MRVRRLRAKVAFALALAVVALATCELAHAAPTEESAEPLYTLEVDSDQPDVLSFEAVSARISSDLGAIVVRGTEELHPQRARIVLRYRGGQLMVRAVHADGSSLERTVQPEGDGAAVQREAVLLASNLARDEAREIIDALATKAPPPPAPPAPSEPKKPAQEAVDEGEVPLSLALLYPVATNWGRPHVRSYFDLSLLAGHVGTVTGAQIGSAVVIASRGLAGGQIAGFGAWAGARGAAGTQISAFGNGTSGSLTGLQIAGFGNYVGARADGVQIAAGVNAVRKDARGLMISGGANVASRRLAGAQLSSINVAESVNGAQVGLVNVARKVEGVQLGVINVVDEIDGPAIGVVSIVRHGIHPLVWGSNLHYMNAGVKFATRYLYTIAAFTYGTLETKLDPAFGATFALGTNVPIGALTGLGGLDVDAQAAITSVSPEAPAGQQNTWLAGHVLPGYAFARHLRVFAGGGVRFPLAVDQGRDVPRPEVLAGVQF